MTIEASRFRWRTASDGAGNARTVKRQKLRADPKIVNGCCEFRANFFTSVTIIEMDEPSLTPGRPLRPFTRIAFLLAALTLMVVLAIAAGLSPSDAGLGTHQQLGLPPCTARLVFGIRCPSCGMTTSWSHFVRGQWVSSLQANAGGFLLAAISVVSVLMAGFASVRGRLPPRGLRAALAWSLIATAAVTLVDWSLRLAGWL